MSKKITLVELQDIKKYCNRVEYNNQQISKLKKEILQLPRTHYELMFLFVLIVSSVEFFIPFHNMIFKFFNFIFSSNLDFNFNSQFTNTLYLFILSVLGTIVISNIFNSFILRKKEQIEIKNNKIYEKINLHISNSEKQFLELNEKYSWYSKKNYSTDVIDFFIDLYINRNIDDINVMISIFEEYEHRLNIEKIELKKLRVIKEKNDMDATNANKQLKELKKIKNGIESTRWWF